MKVSGDDGAMNGYSVPDPEKCRLARAWCAACYEVLLDERAWPLRIGEPAAALEARLPARDYLWITAWNPPLTPRTDEDNEAADRRLRACLHEAGHVHVPARAGDGRGGWFEPGWVVWIWRARTPMRSRAPFPRAASCTGGKDNRSG